MTRRPFFLAALALAGCFTGGPSALRGVARTLPGVCGQPVAADGDGAPVGGATVAVSCPENPAPLFTLNADANGRFHRDLTTEIATSCNVTVSSPGFVSRTYPIASICADYVFDTSAAKPRCSRVSLTARLVPESQKSAEPSPAAPEGGAP